MKIEIKDDLKVPKYQQISNQICEMIANGEIENGFKLPTERQICDETGISRGTVKLAYSELALIGVAKTIQGSGTYILSDNKELSEAMMHSKVSRFIENLLSNGYKLPDIEKVTNDIIKEKYLEQNLVKIAFIDCCEECIAMAVSQLNDIPDTSITSFLLDDISKNPYEIFDDFNIVLTTERHFNELSPVLKEKADQINKVMLSMEQSTIIELAKIPDNSNIISWSNTTTFADIFTNLLNEFDNLSNRVHFCGFEDLDKMQRMLNSHSYLLLPGSYKQLNVPALHRLVSDYESKGCKIILFNYKLDKGSMLHFKESVKKERESLELE